MRSGRFLISFYGVPIPIRFTVFIRRTVCFFEGVYSLSSEMLCNELLLQARERESVRDAHSDRENFF